MKCGGFTNAEITSEHMNIINCQRNDIEKILISQGRNGKIEYFEVLELQQQVVAGMNFLFKIKIQKNSDEFIQVRIHKNLDNKISIHSVNSV